MTPSAIDRLNTRQMAPIVIFLKVKDKNEAQDLRNKWAKKSTKNAKKLYDQAAKIEKMYSATFTGKYHLIFKIYISYMMSLELFSPYEYLLF